MPAPEETPSVDRSAITGQFVSEEEARANPDTTVSEVLPPREGRPQPAVGRMVHYVSYGTPGGEYKSQCRAAVITEVLEQKPEDPEGEFLSLCILNPTGQFFNTCVVSDHDDEPVGGTWHWPERV